MLQQLAINTFISGTAFLITGLVPLLIVPLLVNQYGVAQYGLLVLVRLLLPSGAFAVFDFGKSETASFAVARGRHDADWTRCSRYLGGLVVIAASVGLPAAVAMGVSSSVLMELFKVADSSRSGFEAIVLATALCFPILLASLVAEGIVKGFEDFKRLRLAEVVSSIVYAVASVAVIALRLPYEWAAFAFLGYALVKAAIVSGMAYQQLRGKSLCFVLPQRAEWTDLRMRCTPLGVNRTIGVGQSYAAPVLIGALLGSAAVGLYDLVTRIPRFLKVVTGILNTAVLPMVMRLDHAGDREGIRRLMTLGLLGVVCLVAPVVGWGMSFSEAILRLWVSGEYSGLWAWQALMFSWPLINALTSFMCGGLLGRPQFVSILNRIVLGQIVVQIAVSLALMGWFTEQSFVVGQIVALCATLPLQLGLASRECGLQFADYRRHVLVIGLSAAGVSAGIVFDVSRFVHTPIQLLLSMALWLGASMAVTWWIVLEDGERATIKSMILSRIRKAKT